MPNKKKSGKGKKPASAPAARPVAAATAAPAVLGAKEGMEIKGWAAPTAGAPCEQHTFTSKPLGDYDCDLDVVCCGICHSDIHLNNGDWGPFSVFPQVSGHEIVGKVTQCGPNATVQVGDLVGVGWQGGSCQSCEWCNIAQENLCAGNVPVAAGGNKGGFADKWRGDSRFCFKVPSGLEAKYVGPLMCGGITVYAPLKKHTLPGQKVGVLGIGGLGHMAIKFAKARGNTVTAFSRSDAKKADTLAMGADVYVNSSNAEEVNAAANSLDCLVVTINASVDWTPYVNALRPNGKLVFVGAIADKPMSLPIFGPLVMKQLQVCGSCIGGSADIREMLNFAAAFPSTWPLVECMPFRQINEAVEKVKKADVRFRMVLEN